MKKKKSPGVWLGIRRVFRLSPGLAAAFCCIKVLYGILPAVYVVLYGKFIDDILAFYGGGIAMSQVAYSAVPLFLVMLFQYAGNSLDGYIQLKCNLQVSQKEATAFMDKCVKIPYGLTEDSGFRDLMYSVSQGKNQYVFGSLLYMAGFLELMLNMLGILLVIFRYSWQSALVVLVCFIPIMLVSSRGGKEDYEAFERYQAAERRLNSYEEALTSQQYADDRMVFRYTKFFVEKWKKKFDEATDIFLGARRKSFTSVKITSVLIEVILLFVAGVLIYITLHGRMTMGVCTMLITQLLSMANRLTWNLYMYLHELFSCRSYMASYAKFYAAPEMPAKEKSVDRVETIEFRNVSFRYGEELPYVLKDLSFRLDADKSYSLVGENGAGKTTVMKLLSGMYDSYEGSIKINGTELRELSNLNQVFSVMFQDYARYELSLRDNLFLGSPSDDGRAKELMETLKLDLSQQLGQEGLDAQVGRLAGENRDFSGGQWQRIAMARALVHPGSFFLLDEPTAALDPSAESAIYRDFQKLLEGRPALLITHRLGAARLSDEILVLQEGSLRERGTHEELLEQGGIYAQMFEGQKGWYED